jgi:DNA-binding beta-propeller fold protein YncE
VRIRTLAVVVAGMLVSLAVVPPAEATAGTEDWIARFPGPGYSVDEVAGIAVSPDGSRLDSHDNGKAIAVSPDGSRVFVTGYRKGHQDRDAETIAYSSAGKRLWLRAYNGPADDLDQGTAIGVSPDGKQVFVAGFRTGGVFDHDYVTLAYRASSGDPRWEAFYDQDSATATTLAVNPDGSAVYVSGVSGPDWATVAYSTS